MMKLHAMLLTANLPSNSLHNTRTETISMLTHCISGVVLRYKPVRIRRFCLGICCSLESSDSKTAVSHDSIQSTDASTASQSETLSLNVGVRSPSVLANLIPTAKLSLSDRAFFLFTFIACTTCAAFTSLVVATIPTLFAMRKVAISLSKLADTAREELPSTMAAIRLSGMEISDFTLELSDLSQEIADGVKKSTQAIQAADTGVRRIGSLARQQTMSMIEERASLPSISLKPMVSGAAKKTSRAVTRATKSLLNIISGGQVNSPDKDGNAGDATEI